MRTLDRAHRFDVTTMGEILIRFSVSAGERIEMAQRMDVVPAGAEANVAVALSQIGRRTAWFGGLPDNALGRMAQSHLRSKGVDPSGIVVRKDGRMGTYFVEFSVPPRSSTVVYDRKGSLSASLRSDDFDWPLLLDTRIVHLTGILPALSKNCLEKAVDV